jgi:hypothetical protein
LEPAGEGTKIRTTTIYPAAINTELLGAPGEPALVRIAARALSIVHLLR